MRFYNRQHPYYCGIDLHVKTMYVCILDTTGQVLVPRNVPSTDPAFDHAPSFSRDSASIYFASARSGRFQIWKVAIAGGEPVQVTQEGGFASQEVGDQLYFTASAALGVTAPLWRMPVSGGAVVKVHDDVINGAFSVTAGGVYYAAGMPDLRIEFFDFASQRSTVVARSVGQGAEVGGLVASADGRTLLYARPAVRRRRSDARREVSLSGWGESNDADACAARSEESAGALQAPLTAMRRANPRVSCTFLRHRDQPRTDQELRTCADASRDPGIGMVRESGASRDDRSWIETRAPGAAVPNHRITSLSSEERSESAKGMRGL